MVKSRSLLDPGDYKGTYKLIGVELCFDFTNTMSWRELEDPHEWLDGADNLATWARLTGILDDAEAMELKKHLNDRIKYQTQVLDQFKATRELIYNIFNAIVKERPPTKKDLEKINVLMKEASGHLELILTGKKYQLNWESKLSALDKIRYSVLRSALQVLTEKDLTRVKKCPSCQWLYLDMSKNKSRRWCTMEDCGNRHKVNAYNRSKKQEKST